MLAPCRNVIWPPRDHRHTDTSLVYTSFVTSQIQCTGKEVRISPPDVECWILITGMCRPIVTCKDHERILGQSKLIERIENLSNMTVKLFNHGCISSPRTRMRQVPIPPSIRLLVPVQRKVLKRTERRVHRYMWLDERQIQKERLVAMIVNKRLCLFDHDFRCILLPDPLFGFHVSHRLLTVPGDRFRIDADLAIVIPKILWVITMGERLTVVTKKLIEPLLIRIPGTPNRPQPPLTKSSRNISVPM